MDDEIETFTVPSGSQVAGPGSDILVLRLGEEATMTFDWIDGVATGVVRVYVGGPDPTKDRVHTYRSQPRIVRVDW